MSNPLFTPEEIAELAAFDEEVDNCELNAQDYRESAARDKEAVLAEMGERQRKRHLRIAAYKREYREANKDQIAAYQREYREANPDKYEKQKERMREYMRRRRAAAKAVLA